MKQTIRSIKIPANIHDKVVAYCKKRGLKIYFWVSEVILKAIENDNTTERN